MKNIFNFITFIFFVAQVSCKNEAGRTELPATPAAFPTVPATVPTTPAVTPTNTSLPVLNNTSVIALNPEHGKPGHRCDIQVGAPLNSPATNNNAQTIIPSANTPAKVDIKPITTPITAVAPGMNPQHGQPGHRCDIAVGAPLNSKPNQ